MKLRALRMSQQTEGCFPEVAPANSLGHLAKSESGAWEFDEQVAGCFDDMISRSVPGYETMRSVCFGVGCRYVRPGSVIADLGCSRGGALAEFVEKYGNTCEYVGVEVSPPMLEAARARFAKAIAAGHVRIVDCDLRRDYPIEAAGASLTLACLTLQFTPIEYRHRIVRRVFNHTVPGGAFLLVEKVMGATAESDDLLEKVYLDFKASSGYSQEAIQRKKLALEGRLVPVTAMWNEDLLRAAGFNAVECIWRHYNFAAWLAVKS